MEKRRRVDPRLQYKRVPFLAVGTPVFWIDSGWDIEQSLIEMAHVIEDKHGVRIHYTVDSVDYMGGLLSPDNVFLTRAGAEAKLTHMKDRLRQCLPPQWVRDHP